jgi:hypothetical protein
MAPLLLDSDIVVKLAQYGALDPFLELNAGSAPFVILPTLRYRFHLRDPKAALARIGDSAAVERLVRFVDEVTELEEGTDPALLVRLGAIQDVDPGEAVLFGAAISHSTSILCTGDKRAVQAIAAAKGLDDVRLALAGRVKCLEQVIAELLSAGGDSVVGLVAGRAFDQTLRICFSGGTAEDAMLGLRSYYDDLARESRDLLAPFPTSTERTRHTEE